MERIFTPETDLDSSFPAFGTTKARLSMESTWHLDPCMVPMVLLTRYNKGRSRGACRPFLAEEPRVNQWLAGLAEIFSMLGIVSEVGSPRIPKPSPDPDADLKKPSASMGFLLPAAVQRLQGGLTIT